MKIKDLIIALQTMPQDFEVIISSDSEGNSFSPVDEFSDTIYTASSPWNGDITEPDVDNHANAIVLWPTN